MKRIKRRYIALQLDSEATPTPREFIDAIWSAITKLYGEYGASLTSLTLIEYNIEKKTAVIRAVLAAVSMVRTSLASIMSIANMEAAVHILAVSGTIKSLRKQLK